MIPLFRQLRIRFSITLDNFISPSGLPKSNTPNPVFKQRPTNGQHNTQQSYLTVLERQAGTKNKRSCIYSFQRLIHSIFDVPLKHNNQLHHGTRKEKTFYCKKHRMDRFDCFDTDRPCRHLADILS